MQRNASFFGNGGEKLLRQRRIDRLERVVFRKDSLFIAERNVGKSEVLVRISKVGS